jgi:signal transduction histidine kinase
VLSPFRLALTQLLGAAVAGVAVVVSLVYDGPFADVPAAYASPALALLYLACGVVAWWRRPANRLGPLLVAGGGAWLVAGLQNTAVPAVIAVGLVTATLPLAFVVHLLLACPSGRLRTGLDRATAISAYAVALVLQAPLWAFDPKPPPYDVVMISPRPDLATTGTHVQEACGAAVVAVTLWLLLRRLYGYEARQRRVLAPLFGYGIVAVLSIPLGSDLIRPQLGAENTIYLQTVTLALIPAGFVAVVLRGGFASTGALSELVASVAEPTNAADELERAVARTLGDPSARLLRLPAESEGLPGAPVALPPTDNHRAVARIYAGERCLGALVYDPELTVDPAAVAAVGRVVAIALDRERLAADAAESRAALLEASSRLLKDTDRERRRIAQDLHDGLQGPLVRVAIEAHRLAHESPGEANRKLAMQLAADVDAAAAALRALVHGVMPAPLVERGLAAAVQELTHTLPVRARLEVHDVPCRLPEPVESTAYFVVAEALTNVVKHADAQTVDVRLRMADEVLRIDVHDDGRGGAAVDAEASGLARLRDRLDVLGGTLAVTSGRSGTRLSASVPCA